MKYVLITLFVAALIMASCSRKTKPIEIDTYIMLCMHKKIVPVTIDSLGMEWDTFKIIDDKEITGFVFLPSEGLRISIDTLEKTLLIPSHSMEYVYKSTFVFSNIRKEEIRFINWEKYSPHTITAWRNSLDSGLVLNTTYNGQTFYCQLKDSSFIIRADNLEEFIFEGNKQAQVTSRDFGKELKKKFFYKLMEATKED